MAVVVTEWFIFFQQVLQYGNLYQMFNHISVIASMITVTITQHTKAQPVKIKADSILRSTENTSIVSILLVKFAALMIIGRRPSQEY